MRAEGEGGRAYGPSFGASCTTRSAPSEWGGAPAYRARLTALLLTSPATPPLRTALDPRNPALELTTARESERAPDRAVN